MPQITILPDPSGLAQGISSAGSSLASALRMSTNIRREDQLRQQQEQEIQKRNQEYGRILSDVLQEVDMTSPEGMRSAYLNALKQGVPLDRVQTFSSILENITKENFQDPGIERESIRKTLLGAGIPEENVDNLSDLWMNMTTGGKTELGKYVIDMIQRGSVPRGAQPIRNFVETQSMQQPIAQEERFPEVSTFEGLTPKEKVIYAKDLRKENAPIFNEATKKVKSSKDEGMSLQQLKNLNNTGKLPEGIGRINVNWKTGELMVPAAANAETQQFVKTVNDFTVKAKDTFGARVTNFELQRFMQRLPTLANTKEGRDRIINQMQTINKLNELYHESLRQVYKKYGIGKITNEKAEEIAEEIRKPEEELLLKKYNDIANPQERILIEIDGKKGYVPANQLDKALKAGAKKL